MACMVMADIVMACGECLFIVDELSAAASWLVPEASLVVLP